MPTAYGDNEYSSGAYGGIVTETGREMSAGGTITVLYGRTDAGVSVTLTGSPVFKVDGAGGDVTFPQTITGRVNWVTLTDGLVTVTVKYGNRTIKTLSLFVQGGSRTIIDTEPDEDSYANAGPVVTLSTTTALAAIGNAINTTGKFTGKLVLNTTTGILVSATDGTAGGVWRLCSTGATTHTPV